MTARTCRETARGLVALVLALALSAGHAQDGDSADGAEPEAPAQADYVGLSQAQLEERFGETSLLLAIVKGDLPEAESIILRGADRNQATAEGFGPVHLAVIAEQYDLILPLSQKRVDVDKGDENGDTPAHIAAKIGAVQALRDLRTAKAEMTLTNKRDETPLEAALLAGEIEAARYLAGQHGDAGIKALGRLASAGIPEEGWELVGPLLKPEDAVFVDSEGKTPLHHAAAADAPAAVGRLVSLGADPDLPDAASNTPLYSAAAAGASAALEALLEHGADPNAPSEMGRMPIHAAAAMNPEAVLALADGGADVDARDEMGATALHLAAATGSIEVISALLDAGADPNAEDDVGFTPVFYTAELEDTEALKYLLEHGATLDHEAHDGRSAVDVALDGDKTKLAFELFIIQTLPGF